MNRLIILRNGKILQVPGNTIIVKTNTLVPDTEHVDAKIVINTQIGPITTIPVVFLLMDEDFADDIHLSLVEGAAFGHLVVVRGPAAQVEFLSSAIPFDDVQLLSPAVGLDLRIRELYKKWNGRTIARWALVRNQLAMDTKMQTRILKYEEY